MNLKKSDSFLGIVLVFNVVHITGKLVGCSHMESVKPERSTEQSSKL